MTFAPPARSAIRRGTKYDTNFVAAGEPDEDGLAQLAAVRSPLSGLTLSLFSTEPGVQFYDAAPLAIPVPGLGDVRIMARMRACASSRKPSRICPTAAISPTACCGRTKNTST